MKQYESQSSQLDALPPRQRQVTDLILSGETPKRIAIQLGLSVHTIREHLETVYRKFDVSGRDELMSKFITLLPGAKDRD
jgi:DNA-binding CsgD family transcriptional regulator